MEYIKIILTTVLSVVSLFVMTKLLGNKQISQMSMFDYINGISIGSVAAELALAKDKFLEPLISVITFATVILVISLICNKSIVLRRFFNGRAKILYKNGVFYKKNMELSKLDLNEFLTQCRTCGYFFIDDIYLAVMENNGKISFLPKEKSRPITPNDLKINLPNKYIETVVISDGKILYDNLKRAGISESTLMKDLKSQSKNVKDTFLAVYSGGKLSAYNNSDNLEKNDVFQ